MAKDSFPDLIDLFVIQSLSIKKQAASPCTLAACFFGLSKSKKISQKTIEKILTKIWRYVIIIISNVTANTDDVMVYIL